MVLTQMGLLASFAQNLLTPAQQKNFTAVSSYDEISGFVRELDKSSELLNVRIIGKSVEGRNLYGLAFSSGKFGKKKSKIKVLIFAQQHGNEQSGKEGALLLAVELLKPENRYLFDYIDLMLVPQVNPDGSEKNQRRNAQKMDLNRNHLILTEPETRAIHTLFDKYQFEVSLDVHEYSPYGEEWEKAGFRKNSEITIGTTTNINISQDIRDLSKNEYLPFILNYLRERNYSSFEYSPGGPPEAEYIRHSTFDINDGRQSLGIQNTFSFIQEGMNGTDSYLENLKRRSEGQKTGMKGLLEYVYTHHEKIRKIVRQERQLLCSNPNGKIALQCEHRPDGTTLYLPVYSYTSGKDSILEVVNYRPRVTSTFSIDKPYGYLIPNNLPELKNWIKLHNLIHSSYKFNATLIPVQLYITEVDTVDFEGDPVPSPVVSEMPLNTVNLNLDDHLFLPVNQPKGLMIIQALEPKSMVSLFTYPQFEMLLKPDDTFPILRVIRLTELQPIN